MTDNIHLKKLANYIDDATKITEVEFEFNTTENDENGTPIKNTIRLPRSYKADAIHANLRAANADLPAEFQPCKTTLLNQIEAKDFKTYHHVVKLGWQEGNKTYVSLSDVYGYNPQGKYIAPLAFLKLNAVEYGKRGDLDNWKKRVAMPLLHSYAGTTALLVAFTAIILSRISLPAFTVNIDGKTRKGKTTMMLGAASISGLGKGEESGLVNFKTTNSSLDELMPAFNHHFLPINEMSLISSKEEEIYPVMKALTYDLPEGQSKRKNSKSLFATNPEQSKFNLVCLSNGEKSIQHYAKLANRELNGGEYSRLMDIAAFRNTRENIFDYDLKYAVTDDDISDSLGKIRDVCKEHHGVAIAPYIEHIMSLTEEQFQNEWKVCAQEFSETIDKENLKDNMRHCIKNFSALYFAGCLAIDAGVLPDWKPHIRDVLHNLFNEIVSRYQNIDVSRNDRLMVKFKQIINGTDMMECSDMTNSESCQGFWVETKNGYDYKIKASYLNSQFGGNKSDLCYLLKMLQKDGYLLTKEGGKITDSSYEEATMQPRWANGTNDRCFAISLPMSFF
jgi:Domain of unknown function (DUF927)